MRLTVLRDIDQIAQSALPGRSAAAVALSTVVDNRVVGDSLAECLRDLDEAVSRAAGELQATEIESIEVALTVSVEGSVSLLVSGSVGADASLRVVLKPRPRK